MMLCSLNGDWWRNLSAAVTSLEPFVKYEVACTCAYFDPECKQFQHELNAEHGGEYDVEIVQHIIVRSRLIMILQHQQHQLAYRLPLCHTSFFISSTTKNCSSNGKNTLIYQLKTKLVHNNIMKFYIQQELHPESRPRHEHCAIHFALNFILEILFDLTWPR